MGPESLYSFQGKKIFFFLVFVLKLERRLVLVCTRSAKTYSHFLLFSSIRRFYNCLATEPHQIGSFSKVRAGASALTFHAVIGMFVRALLGLRSNELTVLSYNVVKFWGGRSFVLQLQNLFSAELGAAPRVALLPAGCFVVPRCRYGGATGQSQRRSCRGQSFSPW